DRPHRPIRTDLRRGIRLRLRHHDNSVRRAHLHDWCTRYRVRAIALIWAGAPRPSSLSHMTLVDVRSPIRSHISPDYAALCADHARAQGAHRRSIWKPIGVHRRTVVTIPRGAVDQQLSTPVRADVTERHRLECLLLALATID